MEGSSPRLWLRPRSCATAGSSRTRFRRGLRVSFRFAIQIAQPPSIKERSCAATRPEIIEPRNRGGLVNEQIEATIWNYFEINEVGASFGQHPVGKPDCESNKPVVPLFNRPPLALRQCVATD